MPGDGNHGKEARLRSELPQPRRVVLDDLEAIQNNRRLAIFRRWIPSLR